MSQSAVAKSLAAKVAPGLQAAALAHEEDFVVRAGGPIKRTLARGAFPLIVREIPPALEVGADAFLDHFGGLSLGAVAQAISDHNKAKGRESHWSVMAATLR